MTETDRDIKNRMIERLSGDVRIDPAEVDIQVENGTVTVRGEVSNFAGRSAVMEAAWSVPDVREVRDRLSVRRPKGIGNIPSDSEIQERVANLVAWNPSFNEKDTEVRVSDGVVTLEGSVNAHWKREALADIAASVWGVIQVRDELAVVPTEALTDRDLAREVVAALERNVLVDASRIEVGVADGVVTLTGKVSNPAARKAAEEAASRLPGAVEIRNHVEVVQTA